MLTVKQLPPLREILSKGKNLSIEESYDADRILRPLVVMQEHPTVALKVASGIEIPPHERIQLDVAHRGAISNVFVGSRGTSKTTTICVLYESYKNLFNKNRKGILLSASGFRGGQLVFNDMEKWIQGGWADQEADLVFLRNATVGDKPVKRSQNYWQIEWSSLSGTITVPTNDPAKLRGMRGTDLLLDEANFMDLELVDKVASSFLNVLLDFKTGGENALDNRVFYTTTIDYAWRDFQKIARGAYESMRTELEALEAARKGNKQVYRELEKKAEFHRSVYVCMDYTDTIMQRYITTRDGRVMEVQWPDKSRRWRLDRGIPFTSLAENGRMRAEGEPVEIIQTYPINRREMEGKLLNGETSEEIWLAEQRNVVDSSSGDVYPHAVVDQVVCKAGRYLIPWLECSPGYQKHYKDPERHFVPFAMWECSDPCVLGVDYAPGNRDFCAFVVIRIGPIAQGAFDPLTGLGKTSWSNVVWCEQHRNATGENVADKIRAFAQRYNLVYHYDPFEEDTWKLCRAIGLDTRGGGNAVRDELVYLNKETLADGEYRILDPLDDDPRLAAFQNDTQHSRPMLDAIKPTGMLNDKLVEFTLGQMQQRLLYLPADIKASERSPDRKYDIAYDSARILEHQLRALQQQPTGSGYRKFFMAGDEENSKNKKDMWAAFIYAAKQVRAHILRARDLDDMPMPLGAVLTQMGKGRPGDRVAGAKRL